MADTLTLTEAAEMLGMNKSNVAAFLRRRKVEPVAEGERGRLWPKEGVERAKEDYEASGRRESDQLRADVARGDRQPQKPVPNPTRTGRTQRLILLDLAGYAVAQLDNNNARQARMRLRDRGLIEQADGIWGLTDEGNRAVAIVAVEEGLKNE